MPIFNSFYIRPPFRPLNWLSAESRMCLFLRFRPNIFGCRIFGAPLVYACMYCMCNDVWNALCILYLCMYATGHLHFPSGLINDTLLYSLYDKRVMSLDCMENSCPTQWPNMGLCRVHLNFSMTVKIITIPRTSTHFPPYKADTFSFDIHS